MHPVVSATLVMAFSIAIVGLVTSFGLPLIQEKTDALEYEADCRTVDLLAEVVIDISDDPIGSTKGVDIELQTGSVDFYENRIVYSSQEGTYERDFESIMFNDFSVDSGKTHVTFTKISSHELHVNLE